MTEQPVGPRCGNNPNVQLTPGDRKAVDDFKARLALQASARLYIDRAAWVDGDPLMEVIASAVYERCETGDGGIVHDDPRTIAAFAAAVARAHAAVPSAPADRAALLQQIAKAVQGVLPMSSSLACDVVADAVLAVLPEPTDRAAIYREVAEELAGINFHPNAKSPNLELCRLLAGRFNRKADEVERMADEAQQPTSTAPLAANLPLVKGRCPACNGASLFLGDGGYVTCSRIDCPEPDAASTVLEQPADGAQQPKEA